MNKIENAEQLRTEINRLKNIASQQQTQIKNDVKAIREDLKPENILWNTLSSITGIKINKSDFFKEGIAMGIFVLIQRFILKKEKNMENKIYGFVDMIFDKIKSFLNKTTSREAKREEREEQQSE